MTCLEAGEQEAETVRRRLVCVYFVAVCVVVCVLVCVIVCVAAGG